MAASKPIAVFSPAFSTILIACGIYESVRGAFRALLARSEQDVQFEQTSMSLRDWEAALSLQLHGDLQ